MREEEKEEKCTRKGKTNREIERTRGIEEREKIRARAGCAASEPREKERGGGEKGWKRTVEKKEGNKRGKREGEEYESKRAT